MVLDFSSKRQKLLHAKNESLTASWKPPGSNVRGYRPAM